MASSPDRVHTHGESLGLAGIGADAAGTVSLGRRIIPPREAAITGVAILLFIFFSIFADNFLTTSNLIDVGRQVAFVAIVATGMTYLLISRELDFSIGSNFGFSAMVLAWLITLRGLDPWLAAVIVLIIASAIGLFNGLVVTVFDIPSFMVTLGMFSALRGAALVLSGAYPIDYPRELASGFFSASSGFIGAVPAQIFWAAGVLLVGGLVLKFSVFGYHVYATGGDEPAAKAAGIRTGYVKVLCFVLTGFLVGLVAVLQGGWLRTGQATTGSGFELLVFAAVLIGGVALTGGGGSVYGTFIGAVIIGMVTNGIILLGILGNWTRVTLGLLIVGAAVIYVVLQPDSMARARIAGTWKQITGGAWMDGMGAGRRGSRSD